MQNYEIDEIINLMKRYTPKKDFDGEIEEQDAAPAASGGGGGEAAEYPTVTKWESGVTRGPANQIGLTKWRDTVKVTRGKANTLL
jgi:hypothetical protein